jgi:hypothetical protein
MSRSVVIGDAFRQVALGAVELIQFARPRAQVRIHSGNPHIQSGVAGESKCMVQILAAALVIQKQPGRTDGGVYRGQCFGVPEALGQIERFFSPNQRLCIIAVYQVEVGSHAVGERQFTARGQVFEHVDRCMDALLQLGGLSGTAEHRH